MSLTIWSRMRVTAAVCLCCFPDTAAQGAGRWTHLGLRLIERDAGFEAADSKPILRRAIFDLRLPAPGPRNPSYPESESRAAAHRRSGTVCHRHDRLPERSRVSAEMVLPICVADHQRPATTLFTSSAVKNRPMTGSTAKTRKNSAPTSVPWAYSAVGLAMTGASRVYSKPSPRRRNFGRANPGS